VRAVLKKAPTLQQPLAHAHAGYNIAISQRIAQDRLGLGLKGRGLRQPTARQEIVDQTKQEQENRTACGDIPQYRVKYVGE